MEPTVVDVWFTAADKHSPLLSSIKKLNDSRNEWTLVAVSASEKGKERAALAAKEPAVLYASSRADVEQRIESLIDADSIASEEVKAQSKLYLAQNAFTEWRADRSKTKLRKSGAGLQSLLCTFAEFLQSFSGIAELIKGADAQYGGLAYGTISLLLSVAVHKQRREDNIEQALQEFAYAFPRLQTLRRLNRKDSLRALIADVFGLVIMFCRETAEYLAPQGSLRRLASAMSPRELKMETVAQIREKLLEMRKETEIVMLELICAMREQLKELTTTTSDTNSRVHQGFAEAQTSWESANSRARDAHLGDLRRVLGNLQGQGQSLNTNIAQYRAVLDNEHSLHECRFGTLQKLSWDKLGAEPAVQAWTDARTSRLLLLAGQNWLKDSQTELNWLSYAAILVVEGCELKRAQSLLSSLSTPKPVVIYYLCQPLASVSKQKRSAYSDVVRHLVYQLAAQHPQGLWSLRNDIEDAVQTELWQHDDNIAAFAQMTALMVSVLTAFNTETEMTIIIDRLDRCRWADDVTDDKNDLDIAVRSLLSILREGSLRFHRIKVVLVMDAAPAKSLIVRPMIRQHGAVMEQKIDWDQEVV